MTEETKLKTLKDLIYGLGEFDKSCDPYELRQEAIKWIKYFDDAQFDYDNYDKLVDRCDEYSCNNVRKFIIHFFNLTEGDLK